MKIKLLIFILFYVLGLRAQLKFVIEDFEGLADGMTDLKANGVFSFGNIRPHVDSKITNRSGYLGDRALTIQKSGAHNFGGWGKGIGLNVALDANDDYLNFYIFRKQTPARLNIADTLKIEIQEDDNGNNFYEKQNDDSWIYFQEVKSLNDWELISIPLNRFKDDNIGGDGQLNIDYERGKIFSIIFSLDGQTALSTTNGKETKSQKSWSFDFICFSKGRLPTGKESSDPPSPDQTDFSVLGAWSVEGNIANFSDIPLSFEKLFMSGTGSSVKKLAVSHFFHPFAFDGGNMQNFYPSAERINKVIQQGYIPMITLEDHFVNTKPGTKQPNLYSIIEGHLDFFFIEWAKEIKHVNGVILLRILHEFNGDWYPWCIANNDRDPKLFIKAYRHIHNIFKQQGATHVKFIWCPNSMSIPQEKWNFIMDAYPGDEYVDFVGLDIYNGAGKSVTWRSFRKEGIENYFTLTQRLPDKPLFVCETASRERRVGESTYCQNKAQWIMQMSEALSSDMSKVRLLTWFNEKKTFQVDSSPEAKDAFLNSIFKKDYFKNGTEHIYPLLQLTSPQ